MPSQKRGCLCFFGELFTELFGVSNRRIPDYPYGHRQYLFSRAEFSFFRVLQQAVGDRYYIIAKVRVLDLLYVKRTKRHLSARNRIDRKHVDFVLCNPQTMQPVAAIELDDSSHQRDDRRQRDDFMDKVFAVAGLPLIHVKAARTYNVNQIADEVDQHLTTKN